MSKPADNESLRELVKEITGINIALTKLDEEKNNTTEIITSGDHTD